MIEVLILESDAGSMKLAKGLKSIAGSSTAVLMINDDGTQPTAGALKRKQVNVEEEHRIKRLNTVTVEGNQRETVRFLLNLSAAGILNGRMNNEILESPL